jgi:hypothetical protein
MANLQSENEDNRPKVEGIVAREAKRDLVRANHQGSGP